jgi:uncharacterized protein (DUF2141 family)
MRQNMNYRIFLTLLPIIVFTELQAQATLQVTVNHVSSGRGKILFALFNKANGFPDNQNNAFKLLDCAAAKGSVKIVIGDLPPGTYALAVFHDANNDGELNTNLLGVPKEDYGFSNNARPGFRAPTFKEAAFRIENTTALSVTIK